MDVFHIKHEIVDLDEIESDADDVTPVIVNAIVKDVGTSTSVVNDVQIHEENVIGSHCIIEQLLRQSCLDREFSVTLKIIKDGRPTPTIHVNVATCYGFAKGTNKVFKDHHYEKIEWLTGCDQLCKLYCWPCLLFDHVASLWNFAGFDDLTNFHKTYKRHENTQNHIVSMMQYVAFVKNHCDKDCLDTDESIAASQANKEALKAVIIAVCAAGVTQHTGGINSRQLLRLAKSDNIALTVVPELHLKVIDSLNSAFKVSLADTLNESPFVSLFLDELPGDRFATVFRYTTSRGELKDTFAGFIDGNNNLSDSVTNLLKEYKVASNKLVSILLGCSSQPDILIENSKMLVIHSPAHRLSQVIEKSLVHLKECATFFHLTKSFESWLSDEQVELEFKSRVQYFNVSRWKEQPITALHEHREDVRNVLQVVLQQPSVFSSSSYVFALALQNALNDLSFNFLLEVFNELFPALDSLVDMIVNHTPDIKTCSETFNDYVKVISWKKEKFDSLWEAMDKSDNEEQITKKPRLDESSQLNINYRELFETIVSTLVNEVTSRYTALSHFSFNELIDMKANNGKHIVSEKHLMTLRNNYDCFESSRLKNELIIAYAQIDFKHLNCEQLLRHLYETGLGKPLKQVTLLARLIIVLPYACRVSNETSSRLFSRIQTLAKKALTDQSVLPWAFISFENRLLNKLSQSDTFLNHVLELFSQSNPQVPLILPTPKTL